VAGRFLAERPHLAILAPCPGSAASYERYQRSYQNATMRLLRLGYVTTRSSDERTCLLAMSSAGWAKLEALGTGAEEPPDILDAVGVGRGQAWSRRRPMRASGT
jgi:hypothetical protein